MSNTKTAGSLYTLVSFEEFKSLFGVDDREDKIVRFCLITATFTIEQYCKRRLLRKKHFEVVELHGGLFIPLREYPVSDILAVYVMGNGEILEPEFYRTMPDCGMELDIPFTIELSPAVLRMRCKAIKAVYWAGYSADKVPPDLAAACMELAAWNLNRYRGRRVGMSGNVRGDGKEGEHFEMSMPENVKALLEPYKRRVI
jgi:hypothetical protein